MYPESKDLSELDVPFLTQTVTGKKTCLSCSERYTRQNWQSHSTKQFFFFVFHFVRRLKNGIDCDR